MFFFSDNQILIKYLHFSEYQLVSTNCFSVFGVFLVFDKVRTSAVLFKVTKSLNNILTLYYKTCQAYLQVCF